ncbi:MULTISPECIES: sensor histidine kinase [Sphingobacterium]|jgi:two-component system phosphate regulon sensor histidine kinase PhoR|uniref:histidine kinase n=1 Tax=Sphingobacterium litopenaei TaxID=2763500 RepID=A0ABR7YCJ4_9SPHI|nr:MULTISPECIES: HAMP domain-containing sensor histidine kinase [Sphingobacterium]MBD1429025.1 HAMP domain-containing histidine kinase [Sphingobacterium litopenaei]NGM72373.1 HAMP domain-containing histidine kinase [Sphingobacterium sp. SGL-16]
MARIDSRYRKNFGLLIVFLLFVTLLFVISVFFARTITTNFVQTDFNNRKAEVFDETISDFNEFFQEKIPEVAYYQGFMDSVQAKDFSNAILRKYPFVQKIDFSDILFTNIDSIERQMRIGNFGASAKSSFEYKLTKDFKLQSSRQSSEGDLSSNEELYSVFLKLCTFLGRENIDTSRISNTEVYKLFYNIQPGKISYMNIPRMSDILSFRKMMVDANYQKSSYEQDFYVFYITPTKIQIKNKYPNLYEKISILPVVDQYSINEQAYLRTEIALPGALSDYKLQLETSQSHITKEINKWFFPVVGILVLIYLILLLIGYLIYRNVLINNRMFQLQYDFINNLTHEFKTPVSVIKIAGNNIKSAEQISDAERAMYGRILDQEADKLNSLMNKLLSFAQIENKSIKFNGEFIDLKEFCQHIFESTRIKYPDLELVDHVDVKDEIYADPVLLNSVFQNLIDNAYKYSSPSKRFLEIKVEQTKKNFVILFKDRGIGIDKKEFNSIFKKFYRVKNQFNQQGSIGLGLAFCKEITEFMGGEIKVESEINIGTSFTLIFPIEVKNV